MRQRWTDPDAIEAETARSARLRSMPFGGAGKAVFARAPPAGLSKDLLRRMIAWRMQEQAFGGLDRESLTYLDGLARHARPARRQLKPGTVLVRDYQGQRHTVTVAPDGYLWQGATYPSLSAIARAITGTAWSGPRFFALQGAGAGAKRKSAAGPKHRRHHHRPARGRDGSQPATGLNQAPVHLETASHA